MKGVGRPGGDALGGMRERRRGSWCAERCKPSKSGSIPGTKRAERDVDGKVMNSRQLLQRLLLIITTIV